MASFFEKLKKGMNIEETLNKENEIKTTDDFSENSSLLLESKIEAKNRKKILEKAKKEKKKEKKAAASIKTTEKERSQKEKEEKKDEQKKKKNGRAGKKIEIKEEKIIPADSKKKTTNQNFFEQELDNQEAKPPIDIYQTEKELVIQSIVAGVKPEDLEVVIENDILIIKGKRERPGEKKKEENYFFQECYWGPFFRKKVLPVEVDSSRAQGSLNNGILTIKMPKIERNKRRRIEIK